MIVLFRNDSNAETAEIRIPGFPDGSYTLTFWTNGKASTANGHDFRAGTAISFDGDETVKVIEVRRNGGSAR
jgi:hypothetical protein